MCWRWASGNNKEEECVSGFILANKWRSDQVELKSGRARSLHELIHVDTGASLVKYSDTDLHGLVDWGSWEGCHWRWVL